MTLIRNWSSVRHLEGKEQRIGHVGELEMYSHRRWEGALTRRGQRNPLENIWKGRVVGCESPQKMWWEDC